MTQLFSVLFPVVQYFIFTLKNIALAVGRNPVSWLREQLLEVIRIRKQLGVNRIEYFTENLNTFCIFN